MLLVTATACREQPAAERGGTLAIAAPADPDNLFPPLAATNVSREIVDQLFDYLADIGPALNTVGDRGFTPRLAERWEWGADSLSIAFHLNPRARWHDGAPVTARDVQFTYRLVLDSATASPVASSLPDIDSVSVRDSLTPVVWLKRRTPEAFYETVYNVAILPEHSLKGVAHNALAASAFARHPVGSGRFRFKQWDAGTRIEIVSDTNNYRGRAKLDRVVWLVSAGTEPAARRLIAGEAQVLEDVNGATAQEVSRTPSLRLITMAGLNYGYLGFNTARAPFTDRTVRRAVSMMIDRQALVRNVFDTLAVPGIGPVTHAIPTADTSLPQIPYDTAQAARAMAGREVAFTILVPTSSAIRMKYATLLQEQLRKAGVRVTLEPLELNAFSQRLQRHDFDAVLNAWHTDPSPAVVSQAWGSGAATGGANFTSYRSPVFDSLVTNAAAQSDPAAAQSMYRRAYRVITDDAPAVWLYEARVVLGVNRNVRVTGVRPDAWWAGLADWTVLQ